MSNQDWLPLVAAALAGYLIGSIPTGFIVVRALTGQDVRKIGSGRTGGSNVLRVPGAGKRAFLLTVIGDISKGLVAVLTGGLVGGDIGQLVAGFFALVGNNWSLYLRGQGGAGVMTTVGTLLAIAPIPMLIFSPVPLLVIRFTHITSLGSLTAVIGGLLIFFVLAVLNVGDEPWRHFTYVLAVGLLLIIVHIPNIRRLLSGRERKVRTTGEKNVSG
jgi:glycerol-3-phosphate acyltransferase PlsY